jgi:hypothetical protein
MYVIHKNQSKKDLNVLYFETTTGKHRGST